MDCLIFIVTNFRGLKKNQTFVWFKIRCHSIFLNNSYRKSLFRLHWNSWMGPSTKTTKIGTQHKLSHPQYWKRLLKKLKPLTSLCSPWRKEQIKVGQHSSGWTVLSTSPHHDVIRQLHTSIYDKRDDFIFHITNFPISPTKRRRSDPVLWQKPLHQQKCQKGQSDNILTP